MSKIEFEPTDNKVGCFIYTDLQELKKDQIDEIKKLLNKYGVLFFKNQSLNPEQYVNFSSNFGKPAKSWGQISLDNKFSWKVYGDEPIEISLDIKKRNSITPLGSFSNLNQDLRSK